MATHVIFPTGNKDIDKLLGWTVAPITVTFTVI